MCVCQSAFDYSVGGALPTRPLAEPFSSRTVLRERGGFVRWHALVRLSTDHDYALIAPTPYGSAESLVYPE
jgi:hypothetical protein